MRDKIKRIKEFVIEKHHSGDHEEGDFKYHIWPVVENALLLAEKLNANKEVVEVAALLHDIGRSEKIAGKYNTENDHHIIGEKEAEKVMKEVGFEQDFIDKVKHCVLTHRGRKGPAPETVEAKIIASADAMSHFDTFLDLFDWFIKSTNNFEEAVTSIGQKMERNWEKKLLPEAKEMKKDKYDAIMLTIKSMENYF